MSDVALPAAQEYRRPKARDLGDVPLDVVDFLDAMSGLTPLQLGVYMRLRTSLWLRGALPVGLKAIASLGGITPRTFERMAPALHPLFDHDADGRWRDYDLEAKRGSLPVPPLTPDRPVDPSVSERRRAAGRAGAAKRWTERSPLKVVGGLRTTATTHSWQTGPIPMAKRTSSGALLPCRHGKTG